MYPQFICESSESNLEKTETFGVGLRLTDQFDFPIGTNMRGKRKEVCQMMKKCLAVLLGLS
jgi:hypothetical protein